ncbi:MAG: phosphatase PAP2 family protein [Chloroflexota bacterium]
MDPWSELSLALTSALQQAWPQIQGFMSFISSLGTEEFYLFVMPIFYWCVDKRLGKFLGYLFLLSVMLNTMVKGIFRQPRPFWIDPDIGVGDHEGYGLASGHTQFAATIYFFLAGWYGKFWLWLAAIVLVILMGLSRIYLGAHFIQDVLAGALIAVLLLICVAIWQHYFAAGFDKRNLGRRLLLVVSIPIGLTAIYAGIMLLLGTPDLSAPWASYIPAADLSARETMATSLGALLGFGVGIMFEGSRVRFRTEGSFWQRAARYALGIAVTVALWAGLDAIFPAEPEWLGLPLRVIRYFIILLWVAYFAPMVFVKLKLATADPEPEIRVTL